MTKVKMAKFITAYSYNEDGVYMGETRAQLDKKDKPIVPAFATLKEPLEPKDDFDCVFVDGEWKYVSNLPTEEELAAIKAEEEARLEEEARIKPYMEIQRLETLITPKRLLAIAKDNEELVDENGESSEDGMKFSDWVQSKIQEQEDIIEGNKNG